jgi:hypothetical protein
MKYERNSLVAYIEYDIERVNLYLGIAEWHLTTLIVLVIVCGCCYLGLSFAVVELLNSETG